VTDVAEIQRYGAYLPKPRTQVSDLHAFYGRPGRPRSRTLATPALDEDALTMAYEAADEALGVERAPGAIISVSQSAPFGLRKMSSTLARALGLATDTITMDLAAHPAGLMDAFAVAAALVADRPVLVVASDHVVTYEERVCDMLSAGGASAFLVGSSGGFCRLGASARFSQEIYDVWKLGTEGEPRYRLEVLFDAYQAAAKGAFAALEKATERPASGYAAVAASQPHPQTLRGLGKLGVSAEQNAHTSFVGEIGNIGAASIGLSLALAFDAAQAGQHVLAFGYGAGEGIAQDIEITSAPPAIAAKERLAGEPITIGTYYRWTRGRQAEPH
jgi:hydroxymethylglutaryl-CoA synthase